jgi:hypothetical protein
MNGFIKFGIIAAVAYCIHMIFNAMGLSVSVYGVYLLWLLLLGLFLAVLPGTLPNILKPDDAEN